MQIKRAVAAPGRPWTRRGRLQALVFAAGLLLSLCLGSVYQGMWLVKSGRSMELSDWIGGLARTRLGVVPNYLNSLRADPERLQIDIGFEEQQRLAYTRERALAEGQLFSSSEDWVPASITWRGKKQRVELRLKGDLSDHWRRPEHWSYKVKVKGDSTVLGMKRFALQDPRTRKHMNEWVAQRMLAHLGLIALRYEFVDVTINGTHEPVYAIEENFDKRLIENNQRREGPILRYDQWFYWKHDPGLAPELDGASIAAYQEDDVSGSEQGLALEMARSLMELYRHDEMAASEAFDVELLARFFALIELIGYDHASGIDNLKFYYNPITSRLEPVGYDFNHLLALEESGLVSERLLPEKDAGERDWRRGLFADPAFLERYVAALERMSQESWLEDFFDSIEEDFDRSLRILHRSNPWYEFEGRAVLRGNQRFLRAFLQPEQALQAYLECGAPSQGRLEFQVCNLHVLPVDILALELADGTRLAPGQATRIDGYTRRQPLRYTSVAFELPANRSVETALEAGAPSLLLRFPGASHERREAVHSWTAAQGTDAREEFLAQRLPTASDLSRFEFLQIDQRNAALRILPGKWSLSETLVLPAGYEILAGEGVELDLVSGAALISRSPLSWTGSQEAPVRVGSSDGSGQGLLVLADGRDSRLSWVEFSDLSALPQAGWVQTGAVTFYESPLEAFDCRFARARSEDALNVVRTSFLLQRCSFVGASSDAFDADFCEGRVQDSIFLDSGNDAFDVSGSWVVLDGSRIERCGDKGVSAGEGSRLELKNCLIRGAEIGLASKDRSQVQASELEIVSCRLGLALFEKKPEFGPARVSITGLVLEGAERPYLVERGSVLSIDGREVESIDAKVEDLLYGAEFGIKSR